MFSWNWIWRTSESTSSTVGDPPRTSFLISSITSSTRKCMVSYFVNWVLSELQNRCSSFITGIRPGWRNVISSDKSKRGSYLPILGSARSYSIESSTLISASTSAFFWTRSTLDSSSASSAPFYFSFFFLFFFSAVTSLVDTCGCGTFPLPVISVL